MFIVTGKPVTSFSLKQFLIQGFGYKIWSGGRFRFARPVWHTGFSVEGKMVSIYVPRT
jgi:hypothetical protein